MITKKITLIGSGNLAWHLTHWFNNTPFEVVEIYSRNIERDSEDFLKINSKIQFVSEFQNISDTSDIYFLCIPDDDLDFLILDWPFQVSSKQIMVHGSGLKVARLFIEMSDNFGVFWPIQTLKKNLINKNKPSIVMTVSNDYTKNIFESMAQTCADTYQFYDEHHKQKIHLAAVVANNFTNHLLGMTKEFCKNNEVDFALLHNIILETGQKAVAVDDPFKIQTGPAIRNDQDTIEKHLRMLNKHLDLKRIYQILNHSIELKRENP